MPEKTKIDVLIAGKTYTVTGYESDEYIQRVGLYVDKKMSDVLKANNKLSTSIAAVLTALNVADDYFKAHENELNFKKEIVSSKLEIEKLLEENAALERRNQELNEKLSSVLIQNAKREAEISEVRNNLTQAQVQARERERERELRERDRQDAGAAAGAGAGAAAGAGSGSGGGGSARGRSRGNA
jgi:cell division protein ZapA